MSTVDAARERALDALRETQAELWPLWKDSREAARLACDIQRAQIELGEEDKYVGKRGCKCFAVICWDESHRPVWSPELIDRMERLKIHYEKRD